MWRSIASPKQLSKLPSIPNSKGDKARASCNKTTANQGVVFGCVGIIESVVKMGKLKLTRLSQSLFAAFDPLARAQRITGFPRLAMAILCASQWECHPTVNSGNPGIDPPW